MDAHVLRVVKVRISNIGADGLGDQCIPLFVRVDAVDREKILIIFFLQKAGRDIDDAHFLFERKVKNCEIIAHVPIGEIPHVTAEETKDRFFAESS